jgi:hypothetical protein
MTITKILAVYWTCPLMIVGEMEDGAIDVFQAGKAAPIQRWSRQ